MRTFTDNAGRTWTVSVNVDALKRVKGLLGVDLMEAVEGKLLERLIGEPVLLCDVIYAVCKPQADQQNISDEDFGRAMAGDAIDHATAALLEDLVDFFPQRRRALLRKALGKLRSLEEMVLTAAESRLDSPDLENQLRQAMDKALNEFGTVGERSESNRGLPSGSLRESSDATPAP